MWHASQELLVCRCDGPFAVAVLPGVWHEAQFPVMVPWSNFDGLQATVPWHALHSMVVAMWPAGLPGACALLWQDVQLPRVSSWSKRVAGVQADVVWQASHRSVLRMWSDDFGVAPMREPSRMAREALARRALEHGVDVARLAGLQLVRARELVTGGDVVEERAGTLRGRTVAERVRAGTGRRACGACSSSAPLLQPRALERRRAVAALALAAVLPEVHVVLRMAGCRSRR